MAERSGVEIDYCPACRGVWLDRGELDKIIGSAGDGVAHRDDDDDDDDRRRSWRGESYGKPKKRKSLLGEIFDF
jgi:hypothetical protein